MAKITLYGLYQYDNSILDEALDLPEGIDKNLFRNELLIQAGEFGVIYPDPRFFKMAVGSWCKKWDRTFSEWLRGTQATWNPIDNYDRNEETTVTDTKSSTYETTADYDADRTLSNSGEYSNSGSDNRTVDLNDTTSTGNSESISKTINTIRTPDLTDDEVNSNSTTRTPNTTQTTTYNVTDTSSQTVNGEVEHTVSAYDNANYSPSSKDITNIGESTVVKTGDTNIYEQGTESTIGSGGSTVTHTGTDSTDTTESDSITNSGSNITDHTGTDNRSLSESGTNSGSGTDNLHTEGTLSNVAGSEENSHSVESHIWGNIGVTTSSKMLKEFYDIAEWNLIDHMVDIFKAEFCILIY